MLRVSVRVFFFLVLLIWVIRSSLWGNSFTHASADWNVTTGGVIFSSPAIAEDGSIYIGSNDNKLHAFNADGTSKWNFTAGNWVDSTPAISSDGTIYVASWDNKIYALNSANGDKLWDYETNSYIIASPAIGADGRIYVGSKDSIFYALESNGSVAWEYFAGQPITSSAALGQDGTIYFGDENGTFHAVNPDGSLKWTYLVDTVADTNKSVLSSPALDLSGNLYFGAGNGYCYSLTDNENNATLNWKFLTGDRVDASPILGLNEEVLFVSRDGYIRSLSTLSGGLNWDAFVGDVFYSSPVVDENGRAYVIGYTGGGQNHLFAFDANGSKVWDTNDTNCPFGIGGLVDSSLALSADGKLYYGCFDNRLYCLNLGVGPAASDWPMFQRSSRRDGAWPSYLLEISVSPSSVATASGGGIYNQGATATISLNNISQGYSFNRWSGGTSGSNNPLSLAINSNISITANFSLNQYLLTVNAGSGGSASGNGTFTHGATATITATPEQGYSFNSWSGQGIAKTSEASTTVSMTDNRIVGATFAPLIHSISTMVSPNGTGEVTGAGNYQFGDNLTLTATATSAGYSFLSWSGDLNSSVNPLAIQVYANLSLTANFRLDAYSLELISGAGGTVSGEGNFSHGTQANISATPLLGYSFSGWSGDGVADPNAASTSVEMTQPRTITASFSLNSYPLTVVAGTGGSVSGEGNFSHGTEANISATPLVGYSFSGWSGDGVADPNAASTSIEMTQPRTITASFSLNSYPLTVMAGTGGSVSGAGNFSHGTQANVSAIPLIGYSFSGWNGDGIADPNAASTSVEMTQPRTITASFSLNSYPLTVVAGTGGSVSGDGNFSHGTQANVSATPLVGYSFSGWNGDGMENNYSSKTFVYMTQPRTVTAIFMNKYYSLHLDSNFGGSVSGEGNYSYGDPVAITAIPEEGYEFQQWSGNIEGNLTSPSTTILIDANKSITANFAQIPENHLSLTISANPQSGGSTVGGGSYPANTSVLLNAQPLPGYEFLSWSGIGIDDRNHSQTTIILTEDLALTANFQKKIFNLLISESEGGQTTGQNSYPYATKASLSAVANPGYRFTKWSGTGIKNPTLPETEIVVTEDQTISANFEILRFQLNVDLVNGGIVTGSGQYDYGSNVEISATPLSGYSFSEWEGPNIVDSTSSTTQIRLTGDTNVTAHFTKVVYPLTVNSTVGGSVSGEGKFYYGYNASISALPSEGYSFVKWAGSGVTNPSLPFTSVSMTEDRNVTAEFSLNSYQLTVFNRAGGTVAGAGKYFFNTEAFLTATPHQGFEFSNWMGDDIQNPTSPSIKLTISSDREVTPTFRLINLSRAIEGVNEITTDWYDSDWFGIFFQNASGWAFHLELGWIYPVAESQKNIWFWQIHLGWVWADQETFPQQYLWSQNSNNWLWWERSSQSNIRFYDYSILDWFSFP